VVGFTKTFGETVLWLRKQLAVCQNLVPLVNIKIAGKWMFIPLKMVLIGIDPYPIDHPIMPFNVVPSRVICLALLLSPV